MASTSNVSNTVHSLGKTLISFNSSQFPLKLTSQNYPTWHAQVVPVLHGHNLLGYVERTLLPPSLFVRQDGKDVRNSNYEFWICQDQLILAAVIASKSFSVMHVVSSAETSADAWVRLQTSFANQSAMRILSLHEKLSNLKRETESVSKYLKIVKTIYEDLALFGSPVSTVDLVIYVLNGIGSDFKYIAAAVRARDTMISFEELEDKLLSHELYLKRAAPSFDLVPITANNVQRGTFN
ncbi:uncharacterized protein LOC105638832 [Jatropha curcas]|uniref:uncharacterized protein LOC105638832 n=1 Tax=Jatropha curcas TaxID=180498 RepID=UPI0005FB232F|nr:uncharacterized protein LOC105638832 [Jatropha curcas]